MNAKHRFAWVVLVSLLCLSPVMAQESGWPRTVALDEGTITIYEPQVDEFSDDFIRFRAALAYRENPEADPVFGAGWFESELKTNRFSDTVHPVGMKATQTRFPMDADLQARLSEALSDPAFAAHFVFSKKELEDSARIAQAEAEAADRIETAPPKIIYRDNPALLVTIDGEPVLRDIENTPYEAVINTPYPLVRDGGRYYLNAAKNVWYRASGVSGPWAYTDTVPAGIAALVKPEDGEESEDSGQAMMAERVTAANAPEIVVSTEAAELIVTDGPAAFVPLVDDLLVLNNSDDDVFMHLEEQRYYIVLAGRWYRSESLNGPWLYRDSSDLPEAFSRIPGDSDQADSRVYVAGTEEAREAVLDAQVPQTAAVERGEVDIQVRYDGEPVFAPVDGTDMVYATNTGSTVIYANGLYYMVEDGVWYVSHSWDGPWQVSVARPDQVRVILPSSPVYNVKYVYVYDYTPSVVYVGYTPGYTGSYVYRRTVFYGSGYYYAPWVTSRWYYPHHRTWGFHVRYDPWYGWNFGVSWAWGPFGFSYWPGGYWHNRYSWHHRHYSYWGPHGYRPRHHYHHHTHHHYYNKGNRGGGNRPVHGPNPRERHHNLYADSRQPSQVVKTQNKPPKAGVVKSYKVPGGKRLAQNQPGLVSKNKVKDAYAPGKTVTRTDLTRKASSAKPVLKTGAGAKSLHKKGGQLSVKNMAGATDGFNGKSKQRVEKGAYASVKSVSKTDLANKAKTTRAKPVAVKTGKQKVGAKYGTSKTTRQKTTVLKSQAAKVTGSSTGKVLSGTGYGTSSSKTRVANTGKSSRPVTGTRSAKKSAPSRTVDAGRPVANVKVRDTGSSRKIVAPKTYAPIKTMPSVRVTNPRAGSTKAPSGNYQAVSSTPAVRRSQPSYSQSGGHSQAPRAVKQQKQAQPKQSRPVSRGHSKNAKQAKNQAK